MSHSLDPATIQALASFRLRRRALLRRRAWLMAGAALLTGWLIIALLDRVSYMPDAWRKGLSYTAYLGVLFSILWLFWRQKREATDEVSTAKLMETADQSLHETVLPAVELADRGSHGDSEEFLSKLQQDAGSRLSGFQAEQILPSRLLRRWQFGLAGIVLLGIGLSFISSLHLPGFMLRAALPFANLKRPSTVKILITSPVKRDAIVPIGSAVPLGVQVEGKHSGRVLVETKVETNKAIRTEIFRAGDNRYEGTLSAGQTGIKYRVHAGDAITAWHTIEARARPRIVKFTKIIQPPAYTKLPESRVDEEHGNVMALEGSTVRLELEANQDIETQAITLSPDAKTLASELKDKHTISTSFTMDGKADAWQLSLTARETGFTNDEETPWQLDTTADLPPTVVITEPAAQMEVRSGDVVLLAGSAADDIGLAKVEWSHAINGTNWKDTIISDKSEREAAISLPLELSKLSLRPGDALLVKLVATDLKGQRAESVPVRLFIMEDKLNPNERAWAEQRRQLAQQAQLLLTESRELTKQASQVRKLEKKNDSQNKEAQETEAALAQMKQNLASVQSRADDLWKNLKEAAQAAPDTLRSQEMNLVGQHLAEMRGAHLKALHEQLASATPEEKILKQASGETHGEANIIAEALRAFAAADAARVAEQSFAHLAPRQNQLADKAIDANRNTGERPQWQEQQRAAMAAAESAKEDLKALREVARDNLRNEIDHHLKNLEAKIPGVEQALDSAMQHQAPEFIYGQAHELRNAANWARDATRGLAQQSSDRANEMRDQLQQRENQALASIDRARDQLSRAANEKPERPQQKQAAEEAVKHLAAAARQLKDQSEMREQNALTNTKAALDQNRLGRALDKMAELIAADTSKENAKVLMEQAKQLTQAARTLQADAMAEDAASALEEARHKAETPQSAQETLLAAQAAQSQLKPLANALRKAQADQNAANSAQEAAQISEWQKGEAMAETQRAADNLRNNTTSPPVPKEQNRLLQANQNAQQKLDQAREQFAGKVSEAREAVNQLTPQLSELAENAAEALKKSQEKSEALAQTAVQENLDATAKAAQDLLSASQEDAEKLADLQSAMRQEAAQADLSDEKQRQMARATDVGLAQMNSEAPKIAENLRQAAQSPQNTPEAQSQALKGAAQAQKNTSEAIGKLAENLSRMEKGEAMQQDALAAQQQTEEQLGIKDALDESYTDAQNLAELMEKAQENPEGALKALEQQLKTNAMMQNALGNLAEQAAQETSENLTMAQSQPQMLGEAGEQGAHTLERVARHAERLGQEQTKQKVAAASDNLKKSTQAAQSNPSQTPQAAESATKAAQEAQTAAAEGARAQAAKTPPSPSFLATAKSAMMAQALDQLDQTLHPRQASATGQQQQQQQQGQPSPQQQQQGNNAQSSQQQAKQSLAEAAQAQAQSMAQNRAQGMTPGQKGTQPANSMAQGKAKPSQGSDSPATSANGQPATMTTMNGVVPVLTVTNGGDWGHLPSKMAKDLNEAVRQEPAPEYRAAIDSYYKAIAEKSKK